MVHPQPATRPENPRFSSGPCAKPPTFDLAKLADAPDSAEVQSLGSNGGQYAIEAAVSEHDKCVRCWHHRADVGTHAEHPELCGRCVDNVSGDGEQRRYA